MRTSRVLRIRLAITLLTATLVPAPNARLDEQAKDDSDEVRELMLRGDFAEALRRLDRIAAQRQIAPRLESSLRSECLFRLERWAEAEEALVSTLKLTPREATDERLELRVRLAGARSSQGAHGEALEALDAAFDELAGFSRKRELLLHRTAIRLSLPAHEYARVSKHAEALLALSPNDAFARFTRGIAAAKLGRFERALTDIPFGLQLDGAARDARFELALVHSKLNQPRRALEHLLAILEKDPYDSEATYQTSRALIALREPASARLGAQVIKYFETLRAAIGESSRAEHAARDGRRAEAAILRAARRERLGDYAGALQELEFASGRDPVSVDLQLAIASFFARHGALANATARLPNVRPEGRLSPNDVRRVLALEGEIGKAREKLAALRDGQSSRARRRFSEHGWSAAADIEGWLRAARRDGDVAAADRVARLILAQKPASIPALSQLVETTRSPALAIPHLHFLSRLSAVKPDDAALKRRLAEFRYIWIGDAKATPKKRTRKE